MPKKVKVPSDTPSPDTTERKRVEEVLQGSEEKYKELAESITDIFFAFDRDLRYTYWNKASEQLTGVSAEDALGKHLYDIFPRDEQTRAAERVYLKALRTKQPQHFVNEYQLGGEDFFFEISAYPTKSGLSVFTKDITERKRMEHDLSERMKELHCLYGIARIDERPGITPDELYQEVANLFPASWQYPEITCARIVLNDKKFETENYKETKWKQSSDIKVYGAKAGLVEVSYLEERLEIDEGPFLMEERLLIDAVSKQLGNIIERKRVEEKYQDLIKKEKDIIYTLDDKGNITFANPAVETVLGYRREELMGKNFMALIPKEWQGKTGADFQNLLKTGEITAETVLLDKKGHPHFVEYSSTTIKEDDKVVGTRGIVRDITERKRMEEALQQQNEFLNTVLESLTHPFYVVDANDYTIKIANSAAKAGDLSANPTCYALAHKRDKPCGHMEHPCPLEEVKKTKKSVAVEHIHYDEDGNARNVEVHGYPVFDTEGNVIQMVEYCWDITERKRMEQELRSSEERLRILFEYAPDAYYLNDLKGNFVDGNKAAEEITGYKRDEIIGKSFLKLKLLSPRQIPKAAALLAKNVLGQATGPDEFILNRKDGTQIPVEIRTFPVKIEGKTLVLGIARDITEHRQAEAKLRESDERYRAIFESTSDMLVLIDRKGKILDVNENIAQISEYEREEIVGKNIRSLTKMMTKKSLAIIAKNFLKRMAGMNIPPYEIQMFKKNGELRSVEINAVALRKDGRIVGDLAIIKDITERKRMEEEIKDKNEQVEIQNEELQATEEELRAANEELRATNEELRDAQEKLVRSERLAAIGQLAGGVGHELKNPLSAIKNAVYYVRGKVIKNELGNKEPRVMEFLDIIDDEINSSSNIIDDLLGFSRVSKPVVSPARIEKVIEDTLSYTTIPENIEVAKKLGTDLPEIKIDTDQVRQVLVNMILNAVQAMPTGGKLTISAREKDKFLELEIADTGCGIPQEVMDKIFNPLFTTRAKGIGLGLAVCKAIIDRHQGYIEVESKVGKETIFTIKLPLEAE